MIQVESMDKLLPKSKVIECLELLGSEYISLDIIVQIHTRDTLRAENNSKQQELTKKEYNYVLFPKEGSKVPKGVYVPDFKKIKMFPFTILKEDYENVIPQGLDLEYEDFVRYITISTLFHEIRHAWQFYHDPEVFDREQKVIDLTKDFDIYQNLQTEIDADEFERSQVQKHALKIREIFGVKSTLFPIFPKYGET